jgi:hypothetical protein
MAETIHVRGEGGSIIKMDLPLPPAIEHQMRKGHLRRVNPDGSEYTEPQPDDVPSLPTEQPAATANKTAWVGWAVTRGARPDDAEAMTKRDLIEKYGTP